jgi:hypothetical protein
MTQFRARLASVRTTPSRSDDARTVTRVMFEAHDIEVDPLNELLDKDVFLTLHEAPVARTPLEAAIASASPNGVGESAEGTASIPSAGRRRRGTKADG